MQLSLSFFPPLAQDNFGNGKTYFYIKHNREKLTKEKRQKSHQPYKEN
jgi:hypothetical protein